jgi:hypothetical protein
LIRRDEIQRSLTAAWNLFLGKPDAMRGFDTSIEGFWRSFQAILIVAPLYLITALTDPTSIDTNPNAGVVTPGTFWTAEVLSLLLDWVALPLLLAAIGGLVGIKQRYPAYIVVRNWATPLMLAPFAVIALLPLAGVSSDLTLIPSLAAIGYSLRFSYLIVRRTLGVEIDVAIAFVALDVFVSLAVLKVVALLTGMDPFA